MRLGAYLRHQKLSQLASSSSCCSEDLVIYFAWTIDDLVRVATSSRLNRFQRLEAILSCFITQTKIGSRATEIFEAACDTARTNPPEQGPCNARWMNVVVPVIEPLSPMLPR